MSTSVHDPLLASALALSDGHTPVLFIACDIIWLPNDLCDRARRRIAAAAPGGIPADHILLSATHTHSGPVAAQVASNLADPAVPPPDPAHARQLEDAIVEAGCGAVDDLRPAVVTCADADGSGLGTNRHDPKGPAIPRVPVIAARDADTDRPIALMAVCSMHPTVLHEDSTVISGDFPGLARVHLQKSLGWDCPFVYHMGAAGNQSPRHTVRRNTLAEADRLGRILADGIITALKQAQPLEARVEVAAHRIGSLPLRDLPGSDRAEALVHSARQRLEQLRKWNAEPAKVRGAEVDYFGAEETLTLSRLKSGGELDAYAAACLPALVQSIRLGDRLFVAWPGEVFVEFALELMGRHPSLSIVTNANGGLQGYVVTREAVQSGRYEAGNAMFRSPETGDLLVEAGDALLRSMSPQAAAR